MDMIAVFGIGGVVTTVVVGAGLFIFLLRKINNS